MTGNLYEHFESQFPAQGQKPFLHCPGAPNITYENIGRRTGQMANLFVSLGVKPGDRIAVQVEKSADALLIYLAAIRAGAVYLPLNPAYIFAEINYFLADATPALFICDPKTEILARALNLPALLTLGAAGEGDFLSRAAAHQSEFTTVARDKNDLAAILYTSGTTGRSKGAMLTHGNLQSNAETLSAAWHFSPNDVLLHALPIFHTHGLFVATNVTLTAGASMIFLPRFDAKTLISHMKQATVLMGVPTFYTRLLNEPAFTREIAAPMRLFISGSAPLAADTHKDFWARTGHEILERYGMTETNMNTSNPYDGPRIPGSVGRPLPGVELRIADAIDGIGMIELRGPNIFKGYWRNPEKTAEDFTNDGFFITGDIGHIDANGYVYIDGRAKDLIISGGFNIYPAEIEAALDEIPGIAESAVIGLPHPDFGEAVIAVVQARDKNLTKKNIIAALTDKLARYKQPKHIIFVPELPRNAMGKIQKKSLRETYAALFK
jgi:malonyl-CoA/methylmalonyl-CoA synthetase